VLRSLSRTLDPDQRLAPGVLLDDQTGSEVSNDS